MRMLHQHVGQSAQLGFGVGRARRVGRGVHQEPLGLRRDRLFKRLGRQLEAVVDRRLGKDRGAAAQRHHLGIAHPVGARDHNLVAGVQRGDEGVEQNLLAAGADDGLLRLVVEIVLALELRRDRFAQRCDAGDRRIFGFAAPDRVDGRVLDVIRRIEIGLAGAQRDHVASFRLKLARFLRHHDGRGRLYA